MNIGDAIYRMDWSLLSISEKKELLIIMMRSTVPIKFTSSFLITLSLQSFGSVSILLYIFAYMYIKYVINITDKIITDILNICNISKDI